MIPLGRNLVTSSLETVGMSFSSPSLLPTSFFFFLLASLFSMCLSPFLPSLVGLAYTKRRHPSTLPFLPFRFSPCTLM